MNRTSYFFRFLPLIASFVGLGVSSVLAQTPPIDFSRQIRPLLSDHCFQCHGPDAKAREAELRLDERTSAFRIEKPVIVPGQSAQSELWKRIVADDPDVVMPPPSTGRKLTADQKQLLRRWIDEPMQMPTAGAAHSLRRHFVLEHRLAPRGSSLFSRTRHSESVSRSPINRPYYAAGPVGWSEIANRFLTLAFRAEKSYVL